MDDAQRRQRHSFATTLPLFHPRLLHPASTRWLMPADALHRGQAAARALRAPALRRAQRLLHQGWRVWLADAMRRGHVG